MRDPYDVLGLTRSATQAQVKAAYRQLAKKYHPDNYANSPLADSANTKMQEINDAYDAIISGQAGNAHQSFTNATAAVDYSMIENFIFSKRYDDAEIELDRISERQRDAKWFYMKGKVNYSRGWSDQAYSYYSTAHRMEPQNTEYRYAFENMNRQRSGGYRTTQQRAGTANNSGCSGCDMCTGLLCADCCCECMGGDLIGCC